MAVIDSLRYVASRLKARRGATRASLCLMCRERPIDLPGSLCARCANENSAW
jgi:hypothetical protein